MVELGFNFKHLLNHVKGIHSTGVGCIIRVNLCNCVSLYKIKDYDTRVNERWADYAVQ